MFIRIAFIILLGLSYHFSYAQSFISKEEQATKEACIKYTRTLVKSLQLNENEYIKLKELNLLYLLKVAETSSTKSFASYRLGVTLTQLEPQYEFELLSFLTPNQLQSYYHYINNNPSMLSNLFDIVSESGKNTELLATGTN